MSSVLNFKYVNLYVAILFVSLISCKNEGKESKQTLASVVSIENKRNVVEVTTNIMDFEIPTQLQSGWTTFKYNNKSGETHFFIFEKMPKGITIENYKNELVPPFKAAFTYLNENKIEEAMKEFEKIPSWWQDVKLGGGVGLIAPRSSAETTVYLKPGTYVMECYVRMPNGMPHAFYGMLKEIVVSETANENKEPQSDFDIHLSSKKGITFMDSIKAGEYQMAVRFEDQKLYETLLGHDINLVKLDDMKLLDSLGTWIDASNIKAFKTPVPKGLTFLGGVEDLEAGETGYFKAKLEKGNYVLISEIPKALERNMYKVFKVY